MFRLKKIFSFISRGIQSSWLYKAPLLIWITSKLPLNNVTFLTMSLWRNLQNFITESSNENHIGFVSLLNSEQLSFVSFFFWSCVNIGSILIGIQSQVFSLTFIFNVEIIAFSNESKSLSFSTICSRIHYNIVVLFIFS